MGPRARSVLAVLLVGVVVACETVPYTGRTQLMLLPETAEWQMGLDSYRQILQKARLSRGPAAAPQVPRGGRGRVRQGLRGQTGLAAPQAARPRRDPRTVQTVTALLGAGVAVGLL